MLVFAEYFSIQRGQIVLQRPRSDGKWPLTLCETMKFSRGAGPDMVIHKQIHTWTRYTPVFYWSQTDLSSVYKELVRFSFALSAASMYRQNVQTLPSLPLMARAWYKTVTSPSFDWKGLFTSPYQDSIYSIFVLNLFCKFKHERV